MKPITYSELMKEVEKLRNKSVRRLNFTKEQREFILSCRDKKPQVSFKNMCVLWEKAGWGDAEIYNMFSWYKYVKYGSTLTRIDGTKRD